MARIEKYGNIYEINYSAAQQFFSNITLKVAKNPRIPVEPILAKLFIEPQTLRIISFGGNLLWQDN
jgi:hypothetical protein